MWPLVDSRAGPGRSESSHLLPGLWNACSVHHCCSWSFFKDAALTELCVVETIWIMYITEPC